MDPVVALIIGLVGGAAAGGIAVWLIVRARAARAQAETFAQTAADTARLEEQLNAANHDKDREEQNVAGLTDELRDVRGRLAKAETTAAAAQANAARLPQLEQQLAAVRAGLSGMESEKARLLSELESERKSIAEQRKLLDDAKAQLTNAFKALSAEALKSSNEEFTKFAQAKLEAFQVQAKGDLEQGKQAVEALVKPISASLESHDKALKEIENARIKAHAELQTRMNVMSVDSEALRAETAQLADALRKPNVRGHWGELQLQRTLELAGLVEHQNFKKQVHGTSTDGDRQFLDVVVELPAGQCVVIDAKTPLQAFLDGLEATVPQAREELCRQHAANVRERVKELSAKSYWDHFPGMTPEYVVLFLPGESLFSIALEHDHELINFAAGKNVILASPTTLIALLRTVAHVWRQEQLAQNARDISDTGRDVYDRLRKMAEHVRKLGENLERATKAYNEFVGSLDSRVIPAARRLRELGAASGGEIDVLEQIDVTPRVAQSLPHPELAYDDATARDSRGSGRDETTRIS